MNRLINKSKTGVALVCDECRSRKEMHTIQSHPTLDFVKVLGFLFIVILLGCTPNIEEKQKEYKDIIGYWKESLIKDGVKDGTALRKIEVNSKGKLEQSITVELGTQCRIWLNDDDITFKDGHLSFWDGDLYGDMSEDKQSISLVYVHMDFPFLLERIHDPETIQMIDSLANCMGGEYIYRIPQQLDDGFDCTSLGDVNINEEKITDLVGDILDGDYDDTHSLLIVRHGKLVLEEYFCDDGRIFGPYVNEVYRERVQNLASVTKSVNSALMGIAIDQGYIKNVDVPIVEFFPEYADILTIEKEDITIKDLLTMSAGLQWNESKVSYSASANDVNKMERADDLFRYILEKDLVAEPGKEFNYSTGLSTILGEIINRSVGLESDKFAEETLFKSLGISDYKWTRRRMNQLATGGGLSLRARDMAKIGQLYLDNGQWNSEQVISEDWVTASTARHMTTSSGAYGYQWWMRTYTITGHKIDSYFAHGRSGQYIAVFPGLDMIVVSTAQNYGRGWSKQFFNMLSEDLLPAVKDIELDK